MAAMIIPAPPRAPAQQTAGGTVIPPPPVPMGSSPKSPESWDWTQQLFSGAILGFGPEMRAAVHTARRKLEGTPNSPTFTQELESQNAAQDKFESEHPNAKLAELAASIPTNIAITAASPELQIMRGGAAARFMLNAARTGAQSSVLSSKINNESIPEAAGKGAVLGPLVAGPLRIAGNAARSGATALANKLLPAAMPTENAMDAARGASKLGIDLKLGQIAPESSPIGRGIAPADATRQLKDTNSIVLSTIGLKGDNLSNKVVNDAYSSLGKRLDMVIPKIQAVVDKRYLNSLNDIDRKIDTIPGIDPEDANQLRKTIDILMPPKGPEVISSKLEGQTVQDLIRKNGPIWKLQHSDDAKVKLLGTELYDTVMGAMERSTPPQYANEFRTVREQYRNLVTLVDPLTRASPSGLANTAELTKLAGLSSDDKLHLLGEAARYMAQPSTRGVPKGPIQAGDLAARTLKEMSTGAAAGYGTAELYNYVNHADPGVNSLLLGAGGALLPPLARGASEAAMRAVANSSAAPQAWRLPPVSLLNAGGGGAPAMAAGAGNRLISPDAPVRAPISKQSK